MEYSKEYKLRPQTVLAFQYDKNKEYDNKEIYKNWRGKDLAGVHYTDDPLNFRTSCTTTNTEINDGDYVVILDTYNRKVMSKEEFEKYYVGVGNG